MPAGRSGADHVEHKIGSLPIVEGTRPVGIITETDIFRALAEALGGSCSSCLRVTLRVPDKQGQLAMLTRETARMGGNILSLVEFRSRDGKQAVVTMKLQGVKRDDMLSAFQKAGAVIVDVLESASAYQPKIISSH